MTVRVQTNHCALVDACNPFISCMGKIAGRISQLTDPVADPCPWHNVHPEESLKGSKHSVQIV